MNTSITNHQKNLGTFIHLSTFAKWFFPFGNFIAPLILWSAQKNKSQFIDKNGREAINFQLSTLLYTIALVIISIPFFVWQGIKLEDTDAVLRINNHIHSQGDVASLGPILIIAIIVGALALGIAFFEIISVVSAAIKASKGEDFTYPLTINFIKSTREEKEDTDRPLEEVLHQE